MPLRTSVVHGKKWKYRHWQEFGRRWFQPLGVTEGYRTSEGEVTADGVETAKELESEVQPEDGTDPVQSHGQTWTDAGLPLPDEQRHWFLEIESVAAEDRWNVSGWRGQHRLSRWSPEGLRERTPVLKKVLLWVKCCQTASCATETRSWREESADEADYTLVLRNRPSHTKHPRQSGTINTEIRPSTSKIMTT